MNNEASKYVIINSAKCNEGIKQDVEIKKHRRFI